MSSRTDRSGALSALARSIAAKLALLVVVFLLVPTFIYVEFREADQEKRRLILQNLETQGRLIANAVTPQLQTFDDDSVASVQETMDRLIEGDLKIRLLFRPAEHLESESFFYIASAPQTAKAFVDQERRELIATGVLDRLDESCAGDHSLAIYYKNQAEEEEILTSLTPKPVPAGCWVVITSTASRLSLKSAIGQPYWESTEVLVAATIYLALALLVLSLFFGTWGALRRFARVARETRLGIAGGQSFAAMNEVPELAGVASEFDNLVGTLRESADALKTHAEENAHAIKAPIGVIAQSLEPLKEGGKSDPEARTRAIALIERALERLDDLVNAGRSLEEATVEAMAPPTERFDLAALTSGLVEDHAGPAAPRRITIDTKLEEGVEVLGSVGMVETVLDNLLENALDFSPEGGAVTVVVERQGRHHARLEVTDQGPGCPEENLEKIFERNFSKRPERHRRGSLGHFGMGLWLVRRNVTVMGGTVIARNREPKGLSVVIKLPSAPRR